MEGKLQVNSCILISLTYQLCETDRCWPFQKCIVVCKGIIFYIKAALAYE